MTNSQHYYKCAKRFDDNDFVMPEPTASIQLNNYENLSKSIDLSKYKALLFDLDGTLVDNISVYDTAWDYAVEPEVPQGIDRDFLQELAGKSLHAIIDEIQKKYKLTMSAAEIKKRNDDFLAIHLLDSAKLLPLGKMLGDFPKYLKLGLGTGSSFVSAVNMLEHFNIIDYFDRIVTSDQVVCEKPSPITWLLLAEKFNVFPEECLVFEDGINGMRGALMAGMDVIDVKKHLFLE